MKYITMILMLLATQGVVADKLNQEHADASQLLSLSEHQLESLKDTAERLFPHDPQKQWYYIMVEMEPHYSTRK